MDISGLISLLAVLVAIYSVLIARSTLKTSIKRQWIEDVHFSLINLIAGYKKMVNEESSIEDIELLYQMSTNYWKIKMLLGDDVIEKDIKQLIDVLPNIVISDISREEKKLEVNSICENLCSKSNKLYKKSVVYN